MAHHKGYTAIASRGAKHDREERRAERQEAKAERIAARRAQRLNGVNIAQLPADYRGLAMTVSRGANGF
jgi:hypothetical protein